MTDSATEKPRRGCDHPGCPNPFRAKGLCSSHYNARAWQRQRARKPPKPKPPSTLPPGWFGPAPVKRNPPKGNREMMAPVPRHTILAATPQCAPLPPKPRKPKPPPPKPTPPKPRKWTYGEAASVCLSGEHGDGAVDQIVWWDTVEDALEADRLLLDIPCRRRCHGRHLVALRDGERCRIRKSVHEPKLSLEQELVACYGLRDPERVLLAPLPWNNPPLFAAVVLDEWTKDDDAAVGIGNTEMDDADRWLAEHDKEMAL